MRSLTALLRQESPIALAREVLWRTRKTWDKKRILSRIDAGVCPVKFRNVPYYSPNPTLVSDEGRAAITSFADQICQGSYPFLGYPTAELGLAPKWNLDFVSGHDWANVPSDNPSSIRHDGSDVKVPYELSRLQFLPVLAKAHLLTGEERYRATGKEVLSHWIEQNPVGIGINWTMAMEAALRAMSICFFVSLLWPMRKDEEAWLNVVTRSLWEHLLYIEANIEFSYLIRSNHYLSNILGLYCLSIFLEGKGMARKRHTYLRRVEREIFYQVYPDGADYEASVGYHVLVTQMFTTAALLMRAGRIAAEPRFLQRLRLMYRFLGALANSKGQLPQVGDCDDGRVELILDDLQQMISLPVQQRDSLRVSGLLGLGAVLFGECTGNPDDATWYGFSTHAESFVATPAREPLERNVFPRAGVAIARASDAEVLFFAMPNGISGKGSHTHNDKLSVIVRIGGEELLCDSGTCCYTRHATTRNHFRSTRAHNTIVVDRAEQNRLSLDRQFLFAASNEAGVSRIEAQELDGELVLKASHFGYSEFGVTHRRSVRFVGEDSIAIDDTLSGAGTHQIEANFHLAPSWEVVSVKQNDTGIICRVEGPRAMEMWFSAPVQLQAEAVETEISRTFGGTLIPASKIRLRGEAQLPVYLKTRIKWSR